MATCHWLALSACHRFGSSRRDETTADDDEIQLRWISSASAGHIRRDFGGTAAASRQQRRLADWIVPTTAGIELHETRYRASGPRAQRSSFAADSR
jgi:hypothetical protein